MAMHKPPPQANIPNKPDTSPSPIYTTPQAIDPRVTS